MINVHDKEEVEKALAERRASAPEKINNWAQPAGSPMYYYCHSCGHQTAIKSEAWFLDPPPKYCEFCMAIREAGGIDD